MNGWKFFPSYAGACGAFGRDGVKINAVSFVYYQATDGVYAAPLSEDAAIREALTPRSESARTGWRPIDTARKDGTLMLLLIGPDDARSHPLEDTAEGSRTIGQNNFENDGEDRWEFAGWCWEHDHYTQGAGAPTHWMPLPEKS